MCTCNKKKERKKNIRTTFYKHESIGKLRTRFFRAKLKNPTNLVIGNVSDLTFVFVWKYSWRF